MKTLATQRPCHGRKLQGRKRREKQTYSCRLYNPYAAEQRLNMPSAGSQARATSRRITQSAQQDMPPSCSSSDRFSIGPPSLHYF